MELYPVGCIMLSSHLPIMLKSQTFSVTLQVIQAGIITLGVAFVSAMAARYRLFMRV